MLNIFGLSDYYVKLPFWGVVESSLCLNSDLFLPSLAVTVLWLSRPYIPEINLHFPPFSDDWTWLNTLWYIFFFSVCFTNVHLDFINLYVNRAFYFVFVPLHGRVLIIVLLFLPQKIPCDFTSFSFLLYLCLAYLITHLNHDGGLIHIWFLYLSPFSSALGKFILG